LPRQARNPLPIAVAVLGLVALVGFAMFGQDYLPSSMPSLSKLFERPGSLSHPERLGRAATAPLLKICLTPLMLNIRHEQEFQPGVLLGYIEGDPRNRLPRVHTMPREHGILESAQIWGEVADCVYRQNSYQFCDIDNRALAVKAANTFVGQADRIIGQPQSKVAAEPGEVPDLGTVRDRVIDSLKARLRNGALIKEDFEGGIPVGIARVLVDAAPPVHDECAKR
jgi:hypothetical protein